MIPPCLDPVCYYYFVVYYFGEISASLPRLTLDISCVGVKNRVRARDQFNVT